MMGRYVMQIFILHRDMDMDDGMRMVMNGVCMVEDVLQNHCLDLNVIFFSTMFMLPSGSLLIFCSFNYSLDFRLRR